MPALIDDGYEMDGFIEAEKELYEPLRFRFRPSTSEENQHLQCAYSVAGNDGDATNKATVEFLRKHIVRWDLHWTSANGTRRPAEIDAKALSRMAGLMRLRLLAIVQGSGRSDRLPDGTDPNVDLAESRKN